MTSNDRLLARLLMTLVVLAAMTAAAFLAVGSVLADDDFADPASSPAFEMAASEPGDTGIGSDGAALEVGTVVADGLEVSDDPSDDATARMAPENGSDSGDVVDEPAAADEPAVAADGPAVVEGDPATVLPLEDTSEAMMGEMPNGTAEETDTAGLNDEGAGEAVQVSIPVSIVVNLAEGTLFSPGSTTFTFSGSAKFGMDPPESFEFLSDSVTVEGAGSFSGTLTFSASQGDLNLLSDGFEITCLAPSDGGWTGVATSCTAYVEVPDSADPYCRFENAGGEETTTFDVSWVYEEGPAVAVEGDAIYGETLEAALGGENGSSLPEGTLVAWQWLRATAGADPAAIEGAASASYVPAVADVGAELVAVASVDGAEVARASAGTVAKRPAAVVVDDLEMKQGEAVPELTWSVSDQTPLAEGDSPDVLGVVLSCDYGDAPEPGEYDITGEATSDAYEVEFLPGKLVVSEGGSQQVGQIAGGTVFGGASVLFVSSNLVQGSSDYVIQAGPVGSQSQSTVSSALQQIGGQAVWSADINLFHQNTDGSLSPSSLAESGAGTSTIKIGGTDLSGLMVSNQTIKIKINDGKLIFEGVGGSIIFDSGSQSAANFQFQEQALLSPTASGSESIPVLTGGAVLIDGARYRSLIGVIMEDSDASLRTLTNVTYVHGDTVATDAATLSGVAGAVQYVGVLHAVDDGQVEGLPVAVTPDGGVITQTDSLSPFFVVTGYAVPETSLVEPGGDPTDRSTPVSPVSPQIARTADGSPSQGVMTLALASGVILAACGACLFRRQTR